MNIINTDDSNSEWAVTKIERKVYMLGGWEAVHVLEYYLKPAEALDPEPTKIIRVQIISAEDIPPPEDPPEE